jgi:hypothetical protein
VAGVLQHRYPTVAVTGMTGVGKTELVDHLCGRPGPSRTSESGSAVMERRVRRDRRLRGFRFRVVPGENAATRLGALDEVFYDDPVDGVLHVVANGYATGRRPAGTTGSAVADRVEQLARELEDWTVTAHRIAAMAVRRPHPTWLVVVVTKVDLYPDSVEDAVHSYSPGSGTPFGDRIDELRALAGALEALGRRPARVQPPRGVQLGDGQAAGRVPRRAGGPHGAAVRPRLNVARARWIAAWRRVR